MNINKKLKTIQFFLLSSLLIFLLAKCSLKSSKSDTSGTDANYKASPCSVGLYEGVASISPNFSFESISGSVPLAYYGLGNLYEKPCDLRAYIPEPHVMVFPSASYMGEYPTISFISNYYLDEDTDVFINIDNGEEQGVGILPYIEDDIFYGANSSIDLAAESSENDIVSVRYSAKGKIGDNNYLQPKEEVFYTKNDDLPIIQILDFDKKKIFLNNESSFTFIFSSDHSGTYSIETEEIVNNEVEDTSDSTEILQSGTLLEDQIIEVSINASDLVWGTARITVYVVPEDGGSSNQAYISFNLFKDDSTPSVYLAENPSAPSISDDSIAILTKYECVGDIGDDSDFANCVMGLFNENQDIYLFSEKYLSYIEYVIYDNSSSRLPDDGIASVDKCDPNNPGIGCRVRRAGNDYWNLPIDQLDYSSGENVAYRVFYTAVDLAGNATNDSFLIIFDGSTVQLRFNNEDSWRAEPETIETLYRETKSDSSKTVFVSRGEEDDRGVSFDFSYETSSTIPKEVYSDDISVSIQYKRSSVVNDTSIDFETLATFTIPGASISYLDDVSGSISDSDTKIDISYEVKGTVDEGENILTVTLIFPAGEEVQSSDCENTAGFCENENYQFRLELKDESGNAAYIPASDDTYQYFAHIDTEANPVTLLKPSYGRSFSCKDCDVTVEWRDDTAEEGVGINESSYNLVVSTKPDFAVGSTHNFPIPETAFNTEGNTEQLKRYNIPVSTRPGFFDDHGPYYWKVSYQDKFGNAGEQQDTALVFHFYIDRSNANIVSDKGDGPIDNRMDDLVVGAPLSNNGDGSAYIFSGPESEIDCNDATSCENAYNNNLGYSSKSDASVVILGEKDENSSFGHSVSLLPDITGDGKSELIVSAIRYKHGDKVVGRFYVIQSDSIEVCKQSGGGICRVKEGGDDNRHCELETASESNLEFPRLLYCSDPSGSPDSSGGKHPHEGESGSKFGHVVKYIGNFDKYEKNEYDGNFDIITGGGDFIVSAPNARTGTNDRKTGAVYLYTTTTISFLNETIGVVSYDHPKSQDLVPTECNSFTNEEGCSDIGFELSDGLYFGHSVCGLGDINYDGNSDFFIGAPGTRVRGDNQNGIGYIMSYVDSKIKRVVVYPPASEEPAEGDLFGISCTTQFPTDVDFDEKWESENHDISGDGIVGDGINDGIFFVGNDKNKLYTIRGLSGVEQSILPIAQDIANTGGYSAGDRYGIHTIGVEIEDSLSYFSSYSGINIAIGKGGAIVEFNISNLAEESASANIMYFDGIESDLSIPAPYNTSSTADVGDVSSIGIWGTLLKADDTSDIVETFVYGSGGSFRHTIDGVFCDTIGDNACEYEGGEGKIYIYLHPNINNSLNSDIPLRFEIDGEGDNSFGFSVYDKYRY